MPNNQTLISDLQSAWGFKYVSLYGEGRQELTWPDGMPVPAINLVTGWLTEHQFAPTGNTANIGFAEHPFAEYSGTIEGQPFVFMVPQNDEAFAEDGVIYIAQGQNW